VLAAPQNSAAGPPTVWVMRTYNDRPSDPTIQTVYRSSKGEILVSLGAVLSLIAFCAWPTLKVLFGS